MHSQVMPTPSAEDIALLVGLVRRDTERVRRCLAARRTSLSAFLDLVVAQELSAVVLECIEECGCVAVFPPERLDRLRSRSCEGRARSQQLLQELECLSEQLVSARQPFLLLKGPYLAARFYGAPHGREFVDLDLLVPARDRERAARLLESAGYKASSGTIGGARLTSYFVHGFDFVRGPVKLDLHWCLSRHPSFRIDERALWSAHQSYPVAGRQYPVLSDEYEVVLAVLSLLRDLERGRPKLKNVVDLLHILSGFEQSGSWTEFLEARQVDGILGPAANILGLCLDATETRDAFPRLSAALDAHAARRVSCHSMSSPFQFAPAAYALGNKLWCARVYDASPLAWLGWWVVSLPFRLAVHRGAGAPASTRTTCPAVTR